MKPKTVLPRTILNDMGSLPVKDFQALELYRYIIFPQWVETVIEEDWWKQAEIEGEAGIELMQNLSRAQASLVGVASDEVDVELVEGGLDEEFGTTVKRFKS